MASSLDVFEKLFCSFLFMNWGTSVQNCPDLHLYIVPALLPISLSHSLLQITRRTPSPDWSARGLGIHWQQINGACPTQVLVPCTMPRENDEIANRSCEIPEELVKYIYSKTSSKLSYSETTQGARNRQFIMEEKINRLRENVYSWFRAPGCGLKSYLGLLFIWCINSALW